MQFLPGVMNKTDNSSQRTIQCEEHVISAFILTDILLIASYFFGIYLFSREEAEYLSKLADQVLTPATPCHAPSCIGMCIVVEGIVQCIYVHSSIHSFIHVCYAGVH